MTEQEFRALAEKMGYTAEEIDDLVALNTEDGIPLSDIPLIEKIVD